MKKLLVLLLTSSMLLGSMSSFAYAVDTTDETGTDEQTVGDSEESESNALQEDGFELPGEGASESGTTTEITTATYTITANGTYHVAEGLAGAITIAAGVSAVTIIGNGVEYNTDTMSTDFAKISSKENAITIDASAAPGIQLTLQDFYNSVKTKGANLLNFSGMENVLTIKGIVLMDYDVGYTQTKDALIHVATGTELTIDGDGIYYQYNCTQGAGIGGDTGEMNGTINFSMTGAAFIKGTRQGAVIGAGAKAAGTGTPGPITFTSGEYNVITNSRGAAIGGSAGSDGASAGTEVYVKGGTLSVNTDYSGAAVGGGGYKTGNDSSGGTLYMTGGSLRAYVDTNAVNNAGWNGYKGKKVTEAGVNDAIITAARKDAEGNDLYYCTIATAAAGVSADANGGYTILVDGKAYYKGNLHRYTYAYDGVDRNVTWNTTPNSTIGNWILDTSEEKDTNAYLFLTGEDHEITVNGKTFTYLWDKDTETFSLQRLDPPELTAMTNAQIGKDLVITYEDDAAWRAAVTGVKLGDKVIADYTLGEGTLTIPAADVTENGVFTVCVSASGYHDATVMQQIGTKVTLSVTPGDADITVSRGLGYTYVEDTFEGTTVEAAEDAGQMTEYYLSPGNYTVTIVKDGYYASECSFVIDEEKGAVTGATANVNNYLSGDGVFTIALSTFTPSSNSGAWDGKSIDVSWYDESKKTMDISTPAQLAGLAAIVNGIYNAEITTIIDDADGDGTTETYTPAEYAKLENRKIRAAASDGDASGPQGNNKVTSNTYWFGVKADGVTHSDFNGQTINITADLDMGGYQKEDGAWTGARYMTIGGQSPMHMIDFANHYSDSLSILGASFNGTLNGQGHIVKNIFLDRYVEGNFGDSQSVGLVGRLGNHDNDPGTLAAVNPTVENVAVTGYIYARRSVGGIVGKIGQTSASRDTTSTTNAAGSDGSIGGQIRNCVNFCTVKNTDSKGVGGIVGSGWNKGIIKNCVNFGSIYAGYKNGGGICGSAEVSVVNCYNVGYVDGASYNYAQALGTNNGGSVWTNCYWLSGSSLADSKDGYAYPDVYNKTMSSTVTEVTSFSDLKSVDFVTKISGTTRDWVQPSSSDSIYSILEETTFDNCKLATGVTAADMPVPRVFTLDTARVVKVEKTADPAKLSFIEGQNFDPTGMEIWATYSDGTKELVTDYTLSIAEPLKQTDTSITVSGICGEKEYSYSFDLTVAKNAVNSLTIKTKPTNMVYASDETFSVDGMVVAAVYSNFPSTEVTLADGAYTWKLDGSKLVVSYSYNGKTLTAEETVTFLSSPAPKQNEQGYYLIGSEDELLWFTNQVNKLKKQNINALVYDDFSAGESFTGIGSSSANYAGTFDGAGHTITLAISSDTAVGLVARSTAAILQDGTVSPCVIKNVTIAGSVASSSFYNGAAGIVGLVNGTTKVENCVNKAKISGPSYIGGIIGKGTGNVVEITNCVNEGVIKGTKEYIGGIAGYITTASTIQDCINKETVSGGKNVGGIVGTMSSDKSADSNTVTRCGNEDEIKGSANIGGIIGLINSQYDIVSSCYNVGSVTAAALSMNSGVGGVIGRTSGGSVSDVYNQGAVTESGAEINTPNYAGAGGIVGYVASYAITITNAYNSGEISVDGSLNKDNVPCVKAGSMIGFLEARDSASVVSNVYTLKSDSTPETCGGKMEKSVLTGEATEKTPKELKGMASILGDSFKNHNRQYHNAYTVLSWETPQGKVENISVSYSGHVQNIGWQSAVQDGEMAGTNGRSLRLEGIKINLDSNFTEEELSVSYAAHVENIGWQEDVTNGEIAGTTGRNLQVEAIRISLTGSLASEYSIYYRVHVRNVGWMSWTKDGIASGTAGLKIGLEAIEIMILPKDDTSIDTNGTSFINSEDFHVNYSSMVQGSFMDSVSDGKTSGTVGKGLPLQGFKADVVTPDHISVGGGIKYSTHVANLGWTNYQSDGALSSFTGDGQKVEAIRLQLTGNIAGFFDVYYRVHSANMGWLGWVKNGEMAGTQGYSYQVEAIEVVIVPKCSALHPNLGKGFYQR